jgi:hypothetical protein
MADQFSHPVTILAIYRDECFAKLEKLAKRGARYGQAIAWTETARTEDRSFRRADGKMIKREVELIDLVITGEAPRVGDFKFDAALERVDGGVMIAAVPGTKVGKLGREWDGRCDHCGNERHRTHGYVVSKGRTRKIVGRSCLRDYLGTDAPEKIAGRFSFLRELTGGDDEEGGWGGFGGSYRDLTRSLIAETRAAIKLWGWRKNDGEAYGWRTTIGFVDLLARPITGDGDTAAEQRKARDELLGELRGNYASYEAEADKIIEWARSIKPRNDYMHNLTVALSGETVKTKHRALAASACATYDRQKAAEADRAIEKAKETPRQPSQWLGHEGQRMTVDLELADRRVLPDNGFGSRWLHKFFAPNDQVVTWASASVPHEIVELEKGAKIKATFTIKGHSEFRDVRETRVLRLKAEGLAA